MVIEDDTEQVSHFKRVKRVREKERKGEREKERKREREKERKR